jgi:outer membrane protein assembly factor BamB
MVSLLVLLGMAIAVNGCGGSWRRDRGGGGAGNGGGGGGSGGSGMVCSPGSTQVCVGPDACAGGQTCNSDGRAWGTCDCGGTGAGGTAGRATTFDPPPCDTLPGPRTPLDVPSTAGTAIAYQIDVAHTGNQPVSRLAPPLVRRWSVDLGGMLTYPLVVGGRVFTTAEDATTSGTKLLALSLETGEVLWGPKAVPGHRMWSTTAYEAGRVFVFGDTGYLAAFDAATGAALWTNDLETAVFYQATSPPTAVGGTVFVAGAGVGGRLHAIAADTGNIRWTSMADLFGGDQTSPAIVPEAVVVSSACNQVYAMAPDTGCLLWHYFGSCIGGGGGTAVIQGERVWSIGLSFAFDRPNMVLDRRTGAAVGTFDADRSPVLDGDYEYLVLGSKLRKVAVATGDVAWTFEIDDGLRSPILANGYIYAVSTSGLLYAIDARSGEAVWSDKVADWISSDSDTTSFVHFGIAAGEDHLVVPGRTVLVAYR